MGDVGESDIDSDRMRYFWKLARLWAGLLVGGLVSLTLGLVYGTTGVIVLGTVLILMGLLVATYSYRR